MTNYQDIVQGNIGFEIYLAADFMNFSAIIGLYFARNIFYNKMLVDLNDRLLR